MINIEFKSELDEKDCIFIDTGFSKYAENNEVICNYRPFNFIAKENGKIVGMITGHSYYQEVHISDLIVLEEYRNQKIGTKLMSKVEEYFKDKKFKNINLTTYGFQAPVFYQKCGFEIEFVRENKENPKLSKYFLVKYL